MSSFMSKICILRNYRFYSIGEVEANWLERAFEDGEVWEIVKAMNSD
jgi:hypothetical protein